MFVLGVDPGLTRCGYGAVRRVGAALRAEAAGVLTTPAAAPAAARLAELRSGLASLLDELAPDAVAVERVFFQSNVRTAVAVAQASGVVLAEAWSRGCLVAEYTPTQVKSAVTGSGRAPKDQVQRMVQALLELPALPSPPDAADALAIAICHHSGAPLRNRVPA